MVGAPALGGLIASSHAAEFSGRVRTVIDGDDIIICDGAGLCKDIRRVGLTRLNEFVTLRRSKADQRPKVFDVVWHLWQKNQNSEYGGGMRPGSLKRLPGFFFE